ncbi:MAG: ABC transporter ATP-binding protein [Pseudomonadota bacterium]
MRFLVVRDLKASYGPVPALFGVDLDVPGGSIIALLGRNGMGKTTTVKAICGMIEFEGRITIDHFPTNEMSSHEIARHGIGLVPEGRRCFPDLTVSENLQAAARPGHWDEARVAELFPRLGERAGQRAASLSGGEQQMLAIGRALMTNPLLLILDEATEGLAPLVRQEIWAAITRLKNETSMSILLIDKSLKELRKVADRAVVLSRGKTVWVGPMEALTPEITEKYMGI